MLEQFHNAGFPLFVCTSKHQPFAIRILDAFELSPSSPQSTAIRSNTASHSKVDLLARILGEHALTRDTAWMIGDRSFDFHAAQATSSAALPPDGLRLAQECAKADAVAPTPADVFAIVSKQSPATGSSGNPRILLP